MRVQLLTSFMVTGAVVASGTGCANVLGIEDVSTRADLSDASVDSGTDASLDDDSMQDPGTPSTCVNGGTCDASCALPPEYQPRTDTTWSDIIIEQNQNGIRGAAINASGLDPYGNAPATTNHAATYLLITENGLIRQPFTDEQAQTSTLWDVAVKNEWFRINGGDSGPGGRRARFYPGLYLTQVVHAFDTISENDDWIDPDCGVTLDALGAPRGVMSAWSNGNPSAIAPVTGTFVIERPGGDRVMFQIAEIYRAREYMVLYDGSPR